MGAIDDAVAWRGAENAAALFQGSLERLHGASIAVTGATGLIGSQAVRLLLELDCREGLGLRLILPVRDVNRACGLFEGRGDVTYIPWTLGEPLNLGCCCNGFVHCACVTSSKAFLNQPVETILGVIDGTSDCLTAARDAGCTSFVYLSTMEVYGEPSAKPAVEGDLGALDPAVPRNSYPIAKLASENLVTSFGFEFGVRTACLRLAQTFGAGVRPDDGRVFAEFARCAVKGADITLLTDGTKRNCYLSVSDAASAILTVLTSEGACGIYNAANPETYCSVLEMAHLVARRVALEPIKVRIEVDPEAQKRFRKGTDIQLDVSRLEKLGWGPTESLEEMYAQMIKAWIL